MPPSGTALLRAFDHDAVAGEQQGRWQQGAQQRFAFHHLYLAAETCQCKGIAPQTAGDCPEPITD